MKIVWNKKYSQNIAKQTHYFVFFLKVLFFILGFIIFKMPQKSSISLNSTNFASDFFFWFLLKEAQGFLVMIYFQAAFSYIQKRCNFYCTYWLYSRKPLHSGTTNLGFHFYTILSFVLSRKIICKMDFNISNNNKHELELIYDHIAKGIRTRTKCY